MGLDMHVFRLSHKDNNRKNYVNKWGDMIYEVSSPSFVNVPSDLIARSQKLSRFELDDNRMLELYPLQDKTVTAGYIMEPGSCIDLSKANDPEAMFSFRSNDGSCLLTFSGPVLLEQGIIKEEKNAYFVIWSKEVCYQRKGIDNEGWNILVKLGNACYTRDLELVEELTHHGLRKSFLSALKKYPDAWFWPWW